MIVSGEVPKGLENYHSFLVLLLPHQFVKQLIPFVSEDLPIASTVPLTFIILFSLLPFLLILMLVVSLSMLVVSAWCFWFWFLLSIHRFLFLTDSFCIILQFLLITRLISLHFGRYNWWPSYLPSVLALLLVVNVLLPVLQKPDPVAFTKLPCNES